MVLIFMFVLVIAGITYLSYAWTVSPRKDTKLSNMWAGMIITSLFLGAVTLINWGISYKSYIDLRKKLAVIEQYKETVELYAEKGVKEFRPGAASSKEFTDLKYNNYQTQIGEMIRDMRDTIVEYNEVLTAKQVLKDGIMFNWLIYLPDDMKTVKMGDYLK